MEVNNNYLCPSGKPLNLFKLNLERIIKIFHKDSSF